MKYTDIPVIAGDQTRSMDVEFTEEQNPQSGYKITLTENGKAMVVNAELEVMNSNIPEEWHEPILDALRKVTAEEGF